MPSAAPQAMRSLIRQLCFPGRSPQVYVARWEAVDLFNDHPHAGCFLEARGRSLVLDRSFRLGMQWQCVVSGRTGMGSASITGAAEAWLLTWLTPCLAPAGQADGRRGGRQGAGCADRGPDRRAR